MAERYVNVDRKTAMLLPPDLRDWVKSNDLVQLIVDAVEECDLSSAQVNARGTGSEQYPPSMMMALLIYSYASGIYSSRRIEHSTYESVAVRYLCANHHPDHDTIAVFRRKNRQLFKDCFAHVLLMAKELGILKVGTVSLDGTRMAGAGSKKSVRSLDQIEEELKQLAQRALELAEKTDQQDKDAEGMLIPEELADVEKRRTQLQRAKEQIEERRRKAEEEKRTKSADSEHQTKKVSVSEPESRSMCRHGRDLVQGYNAQAVADCEGTGLILGEHLSDQVRENRLLKAGLEAVPEEVGNPTVVLADTGFENSVMAQEVENDLGITVLCPPQNRTASVSEATLRTEERRIRAAWRQLMLQRLDEPAWKEIYGKRMPVAEGVFARIKRNMGFRRFNCWGKSAAAAEWTLVCLAHNVRLLAAKKSRKAS